MTQVGTSSSLALPTKKSQSNLLFDATAGTTSGAPAPARGSNKNKVALQSYTTKQDSGAGGPPPPAARILDYKVDEVELRDVFISHIAHSFQMEDEEEEVTPLTKEEILSDGLYGRWVMRRFTDGNCFEGRVCSIDITNTGKKYYCVQYRDGDLEHLERHEVLQYLNEEKEIPEKPKPKQASTKPKQAAPVAAAAGGASSKTTTAMKPTKSGGGAAKKAADDLDLELDIEDEDPIEDEEDDLLADDNPPPAAAPPAETRKRLNKTTNDHEVGNINIAQSMKKQPAHQPASVPDANAKPAGPKSSPAAKPKAGRGGNKKSASAKPSPAAKPKASPTAKPKASPAAKPKAAPAAKAKSSKAAGEGVAKAKPKAKSAAASMKKNGAAAAPAPKAKAKAKATAMKATKKSK
ncbi:unnamed protein product [Amoebophrya sp. A120]|nr:unnamed protein product [Amoebophrya sp. A120]|eukprot:GSA120T00011591001.1